MRSPLEKQKEETAKAMLDGLHEFIQPAQAFLNEMFSHFGFHPAYDIQPDSADRPMSPGMGGPGK